MSAFGTGRSHLPQFLFAVALVGCLFMAAGSSLARDLHVFKVPNKGPGQHRTLTEQGFDIIGLDTDRQLLVVGSDADHERLSAWGAPAILRAPAGSSVRGKDLTGNLADYHTYAETQALLTLLASTYPTLAELQSMGTSIEGRDIPVLRITGGIAVSKADPKPEVLIMGNLHARELMAVEIPLRFAEYLLTNYGIDADVTAMVDTRDIYVAPMLNPDGHVYVENNNAGDWWTWWRKNRRDNGGGIYGVDLNRNFGYQWGYDDEGSSPSPSSVVYRGPGPFSEPETQAIEAFCAAHDFSLAFSYHSYGELLLYPWGYQYDYTVDHELFRTVGLRLAEGTNYLVGNPAEGAIYLTNGGSDDWAYGEVLAKNSFLCYTPEVNSFDDGGFGPPDTAIVPTFNLLLPMNMRLLKLADEPRKVLGPIAPVLDPSVVWIAPVLTLNWSANEPSDPNPVATYEIEEYVNLDHQPDPADATSPLWEYGGFTLSGIAFSGSGSYYGGMANNLASTLTTAAPYLVTPSSQIFTFKTRYAIEQGWDYAYVEVSTDGGLTWVSQPGNITTNFDPNGSNRGNGITGSTGGAWIDAVFDLSTYLGQTIQVRILYSTDGSVLEEGIFVDDLDPVPAYESTRVVAAAHPTNTLDVDIQDIATYWYRVRATDAEGDTGRWSNLVSAYLDPVTAVGDPLPSYSHLAGNYPNPFNPRTLVSFAVGTADGGARVRLVIFDVAGRHVRTLVDEPRATGRYRETWDGKDDDGRTLANGIYLARLEIGGRQVASHKMTLLR